MYSTNYRRGFTLIELLVVIAIIGILSAVVLASLQTARAKGVDSAIENDLYVVQAQAVIDYDAYPQEYSSNTVGTLSTESTSFPIGSGNAGTTGVGPFDSGTKGDQTAENALNQAASVTGGGIQYGYSPSAYVVEAELTAFPNTYWCIDSQNRAKKESAALLAGATSCL
jgi:prepilin-type N-terminal cleavage/methylation domain-containing protein